MQAGAGDGVEQGGFLQESDVAALFALWLRDVVAESDSREWEEQVAGEGENWYG